MPLELTERMNIPHLNPYPSLLYSQKGYKLPPIALNSIPAFLFFCQIFNFFPYKGIFAKVDYLKVKIVSDKMLMTDMRMEIQL